VFVFGKYKIIVSMNKFNKAQVGLLGFLLGS
jgi:hypothetical protein